jgi:hypothetical protein
MAFDVSRNTSLCINRKREGIRESAMLKDKCYSIHYDFDMLTINLISEIKHINSKTKGNTECVRHSQ